MFRLSRKGWNNVIIVAVLAVITLLHRLETAQQENSAQRARPLLPESAVVLTWQGPSWQIERIGQGLAQRALIWGSAVPSWPAHIEGWQGWLLPPGSAVRGTPVTLKIWVAGQSDPIEVGLYQDSDKFAALLPPSTWLSLSQEQYRSLLRPHPLIHFSSERDPMPELPEVEVSRQGISPWLTGIKVTRVVVRDGRLRWPVPGEIQELVDLTIHRVSRRAKYLAAGDRLRHSHPASGHVWQSTGAEYRHPGRET